MIQNMSTEVITNEQRQVAVLISLDSYGSRFFLCNSKLRHDPFWIRLVLDKVEWTDELEEEVLQKYPDLFKYTPTGCASTDYNARYNIKLAYKSLGVEWINMGVQFCVVIDQEYMCERILNSEEYVIYRAGYPSNE